MNKGNYKYCVAIRTLGKAGEKFQRELDSLLRQTIPPHKILVYLAEGYEKPKETVGVEQIIYVKKGMIAQRALPYTEVNTEYCLLLDDDVFLPPDAVEKMFTAMEETKADCVALDTFKNHGMSLFLKIKAAVFSWVLPHYDNDWAFKIGLTGAFSYNNSPSDNNYYLSQSAAGPCSLWKKSSFLKTHFEEELWLDNCGFPQGEDMLLFNKLYQNGGCLIVLYNSSALHLDSRSSRSVYSKNLKIYYSRAFAHSMIWYRTQIDSHRYHFPRKFLSVILFIIKFWWQFAVHIILCIKELSISPLLFFLSGNFKAFVFIFSNEYKSLNNFYIK